MRTTRIAVLFAVTALILAAAVTVQAQRTGGGRRGGMTAVTLAQIPAAALEQPLQLTKEQMEKITAIQTKLREELRGLAGGGGDRQYTMERRQQLNTKATQDIEAVLTDAQKQKVPDLIKQMQVYRNCGIPLEVVAALKLTPDQVTKLEAISKEYQTKLEGMQTGGGGFDGFRELREATQQKVQAVLTADQKAIVEKWQRDNPQPGRGAGGRGR
ncbi:MAG: hypothetical protein HY321_04930 [Armatimonadetes bacterium]|nr:hypothetical protein [Armatimonadota bacterium]